MSVTAVPQWFWEGDAVVTETAFTSGGRGRIPNFGLLFRTNLMEDRVFNYHKQYLRSYKHNIPNHYVFGYHMVSYLRKRTNDPMIWDKITEKTWRVPFIPFAFSSAISKYAGVHVTDLYREMADDLISEWKEETHALVLTPFETVPHSERTGYTDYMYPQVLGDRSVLVMKRGIADIAQFRILKDGIEKKSFIPGQVNDAGMLSASGNLVVWNEYHFDPRWRMRTYSVIKMYDLSKKRLYFVTNKSRYAGAAISPDQKKIVTVETNTEYNTALTVLDTAGNVLRQFPNESNAFYSMARWSAEGDRIVALKTTEAGRAVVAVNYSTGAEQELLPPSRENIGHPVLAGGYLLYNSPASGIDNIYAVDIARGERKQVTSSRYGAYNPALSDDLKTIFYNEQTRDGFEVASIPFDPSAWRTYVVNPDPGPYSKLVTDQEAHADLFDNIPARAYESKKYSKLSGIFNPYSWGAYFDTGLTQADIGISSQDVLSTTVLKLGYLYDINERTGSWRAGVSYQNWFPIIDVDFKFADRSADLDSLTYDKVQAGDTTRVREKLDFAWQERNVEAGVRIPLITTNSRYFGSISFANYVGFTQVTEFSNSIDGGGRIIPSNFPQYFFRSYQDNGNLLYNRFRLSAFRLLKQNRRDINSKWGQSIFMNWYSTPYGGDFSGNQFSFYSLLYFPGLFKHHSLWGWWGYQSTFLPTGSDTRRNLDNYIFNNQIPLPRGIPVSRFQKFYSMSANYSLPVWYPDAAIGPVVNLQRVRLNAFSDYGFGSSASPEATVTETYLTVGAELKFDLNILRLLNQFDIGVRYSYSLLPYSVTKFEFLLGTINF
jgi:hypothetical protein